MVEGGGPEIPPNARLVAEFVEVRRLNGATERFKFGEAFVTGPGDSWWVARMFEDTGQSQSTARPAI